VTSASPSASSSSKPAPFDADDWASFVGASPHGDVLQCLEWGQVKKPDWQPIPLALRREDGSLRATALVLKRAIPRLNRSIFYLPRGPVLDWSDEATAREMFALVRSKARAHRAILIKVDPAVSVKDPAAPQVLALLKEVGFVPSPDARNAFGGTQPRFNMKLDISGSEADVQARFHQKWRYNTRLATRKGVEVREMASRDEIPVFHELYRVTAQRDGFTGRPLKYFQNLWDALVTRDMARFFVTMHEGKALSSAICFVLGKQCWYVYGASSNEGRNLMPNHAMQWGMMQWARERGCTLYDFRGVHDIPRPENAEPKEDMAREGFEGPDFDVSQVSMAQMMESEDGLVRFKAGFGAQLSEYVGEFDWPLSPTWYWAWTSARPKLVAALKKARR
jgi:peptidoglycan pentaglycine glycine transferase (the first glycine)